MKLSKPHLIEGKVYRIGTIIKIKENTIKVDDRYFSREVLNDLKLMDLEEFKELGYLQELNRRFLHPLGLALILDTESKTISGVWDSREDPTGIHFGLNNTKSDRLNRFRSNKDFIDKELEIRFNNRKTTLGFDIEPL